MEKLYRNNSEYGDCHLSSEIGWKRCEYSANTEKMANVTDDRYEGIKRSHQCQIVLKFEQARIFKLEGVKF